MTIISASDARYLPGLFVTWATILLSKSEITFKLYLLHDGIDQYVLRNFEQDLRGVSNRFNLYPVEIGVTSFEELPGFFYDSKMAYARLLIPRLIPEAGRVLYIDSDIVVLRDVGELATLPLGGSPLGVVEEWGDNGSRDLPKFHKSHPETRDHRYFNSGLLVMDLDKIRSSGDFDRCLSLLHERKEACCWWDQSALNVIFAGRCAYLNPGFNYQLAIGRSTSLSDLPKIAQREINLHYIMKGKPWLESGHTIPHRLFGFLDATLRKDEAAARRVMAFRPVLMAAGWHSLRCGYQGFKGYVLGKKTARRFAKIHWEVSKRLCIEALANRRITTTFEHIIRSKPK